VDTSTRDVSDAIVTESGDVVDNPATEEYREHWRKFIADHPAMNDYQRGVIEQLRDSAADPDDLHAKLSPRQVRWMGGIVDEVREQKANAAKRTKVASKPLPF
jgi:hypothetical protein